MSQIILDDPRPVALAVPVAAGSRASRGATRAWTRALLAALRRGPRRPQVIDLRDRAERHDLQVELLQAQARIFTAVR